MGWFCVEDDGNQVTKDRHPLLVGHMPVTVAKQQELKVQAGLQRLGSRPPESGVGVWGGVVGVGGWGPPPRSGVRDGRGQSPVLGCWSLVSTVTPALGSVLGSTRDPLV